MALFSAKQIDLARKHEVIYISCWKKLVDYAVYEIRVCLGGCTWFVQRRYSEFAEFDKKRFANSSKGSMLPSKKLVGNLEEEFLDKRRQELEDYLRTVFELEVWLQRRRENESLPRPLALFLNFDFYEVHAIVESLAESLSRSADEILCEEDFYEMTPVQLWAITQRISLAEPCFPGSDRKYDFSNVVDFLHRLKYLKISGCDNNVENSNIPMNSLGYSLHVFKSLKSLWITSCDALAISGLICAKKSARCLVVHNTLKHIKDLSANDDVCDLGPPVLEKWHSAVEVDLSWNLLREIDESVISFGNVQILNLSQNKLTNIVHLQDLPHLTELDLSQNLIEKLDKWHLKLGNVKRLLLTGNRISSLFGLRKVYSLEYLDVRDNFILQNKDVWPLGKLPCLEFLFLSGNPIESSIEYRTRVLETFRDRAPEIRLDGVDSSRRELDTVGVRLAIRKSREERERLLRKTTEEISRKLEEGSVSLYSPVSSKSEDFSSSQNSELSTNQNSELSIYQNSSQPLSEVPVTLSEGDTMSAAPS